MESSCGRRLAGNRLLAVGVAIAAVAAGGCPAGDAGRKEAQQMHAKTIEQVKQEHTDTWMALPGVVGTGIGQCKGKPCILILAASNTEQIRKQIPSTVDGYPVVIQYVGEIHALDKP